MRILSDRLRRRIEAEETYRILEELRIQEAVNHPYLRGPRLRFRRYRAWFERTAELLIALLVAVVTLLIHYIVFVRLLHFQS